jgi:hypothetical protein
MVLGYSIKLILALIILQREKTNQAQALYRKDVVR